MYKLGKWNLWFILALVTAAAATVFTDVAIWEGFPILAIIVGVILGFANISKAEGIKYLIAFIAFSAVTGIFSLIPAVGTVLNTFFVNLLGVFGGTTLIVAGKILATTTRNK